MGTRIKYLLLAAGTVLGSWLPAYSVELGVAVSRHELTAPLSDADVDAIFARANVLLRKCDVTLRRVGHVVTYASQQMPNEIETGFDWQRLGRLPRSIKVVGRIRFCGSVTSTDQSGCAEINGRILAASRRKFDHIVWAHEFGHTSGLTHASSGNDSLNLMYWAAKNGSERLTVNQCRHYRAGSRLVMWDRELIAELLGAEEETTGEPSQQVAEEVAGGEPEVVGGEGPPLEGVTADNLPPIEEFIAAKGYPIFPYNVAALYPETVIPFLETTLNDESKAANWVYAVSTLGAIGTPKAREVLMAFLLKDPKAKLSADQYYAKSNVPIALAWIVNASIAKKSDDNVALQTLLSCTNGEWWKKQGIDWDTIYTGPDLIKKLVKSCIISLPLTGTDAAAKRLEQLQVSALEHEQNLELPKPELGEFEEIFDEKFSGGTEEVIELFTAVPESTAAAVDESGGSEMIDGQLSVLNEVRVKGLDEYYPF